MVLIAQLVQGLFSLASMLVLARVVVSWVRPSPPAGMLRNALETLYAMTDPVMDGARRLLPFLVVSGLDLTPIAVLFGLRVAESAVMTVLTMGM